MTYHSRDNLITTIKSLVRMNGKLSTLLKHYGKPDWGPKGEDEVTDLLRETRAASRRARKIIRDE